MNFDSVILQLLTQYQVPALLAGSFFFGESVILTAAFLAAQGVWSIKTVFLLAFIGTVASDSVWFLFGHVMFHWTNTWKKYETKYQRMVHVLEKITGRKPFLALLFIKFLYGTRILTIIYLSMRRMRFITFFIFNSIGTVLWLMVLLLLGWFAGKGAAHWIPTFHKIEYTISALVISLIIFKLLTAWLNKRITKQ